MTETAVVYTDAPDPAAAAQMLADKMKAQLAGPPHAVIVFAGPRYDPSQLLPRIEELAEPGCMVGASSAGEFTREVRGVGMACAMGIRSDQMVFSAAIGHGLREDRASAAKELASSFRGLSDSATHPYRAALLLTDALAGHADDLIDHLTMATAGKYQFFGGGAGDDAQFRRTPVFHGKSQHVNAAVALEILSKKPIGIGVGHGWEPASKALRVTDARGSLLVSLNGLPAVRAFERHAEETQQRLDLSAPLPFFLHNILGIEVAENHRLRVPLSITPEGAVLCAADIPTGAVVRIMRTNERSALEAAARATSAAVANLKGHRPKAAMFFDCVATRLRLGDLFGFELEQVADALGDAPFVGFNSHGQIARAEGQFNGFHNCTAVVCAFPE